MPDDGENNELRTLIAGLGYDPDAVMVELGRRQPESAAAATSRGKAFMVKVRENLKEIINSTPASTLKL